MSSPRKQVDQDHHDNGSGWYAKMRAWADADVPTPHFTYQLTPAEKQQYDAETNWAARAKREDLPGPARIGVIDDFY